MCVVVRGGSVCIVVMCRDVRSVQLYSDNSTCGIFKSYTLCVFIGLEFPNKNKFVFLWLSVNSLLLHPQFCSVSIN